MLCAITEIVISHERRVKLKTRGYTVGVGSEIGEMLVYKIPLQFAYTVNALFDQ